MAINIRIEGSSISGNAKVMNGLKTNGNNVNLQIEGLQLDGNATFMDNKTINHDISYSTESQNLDRELNKLYELRDEIASMQDYSEPKHKR